MKTLLLTTAGNVVAAQLTEVLAPWRDRIRVVGLNSDPAAEPNFRCDAVYLVPPTDDGEAWRHRVTEILRSEQPDMVLPTRDGDLVPLASISRNPGLAKTLFFAPGPLSAAMMVDKQASFRFAQAHGLPFVETATDREGVERLVARVGFPLLAKPRAGTGSADVRIVRTWDQVDALRARTDPVFQEYLGDRSVLDLPILDHAGGIPLIYAYGGRRNLSMVGAVLPDRRTLYCGASRTGYGGPLPALVQRDDDARLETQTLALAGALARTDFTGFFNIQAIPLPDGPSLPFEYNGRLPGISRSRSLLGMFDAPLIASLLLGGDLPESRAPAPAGRVGTVLRSDLCAEADIDTLTRHGRWERRDGMAGAAARPVDRSDRAPARKKTLLLSTSGGVVAALHAQVLAPWRDRIRIVGMNSEAAAEPNFRCDAAYLVPATGDRAAWRQRVTAVLRIERPDMIVPTRDGDLEGLAEIAGDPAFASTLVFSPGPRTAAMMTDKSAQYRFVRAHGLAFVETAADVEEAERLVARTGFPLLAKPRIGTGSQGIRLVRRWDQVINLLQGADVVFQEYVGDRSILALPILDPSLGMPLLHANSRRRHVSAVGAVLPDRRVVYCGTIAIAYCAPDLSRVERDDDPRLGALSNALGAALATEDFVGLFNLQAIEAEDGTMVPIEYNGRLVGAARSRWLLNVSEAPVILHLLLGEALPEMPGPSPAGLVATAPRAEFFADADAEALLRDGVWSRACA